MIAGIFPDLLGPWAEEMTNLQELSLRGRVRRLSNLPSVDCPEALWLGLPPAKANLQDGPLMVAAIGKEPPERTLQFHLSVLSVEGGLISQGKSPSTQELKEILAVLPKLDTKRLTGLAYDGLDHAMVMEGWFDLGTTPPNEALGNTVPSMRPDGEMDGELHRYIDDSVNLLSDLEFNRRRMDEDQAPLNLLWPWGHGVPKRLPNLALRRGVPITIESDSYRLQGLSRLTGYRHTAKNSIGKGFEIDWPGLLQRARTRTGSLISTGAFSLANDEEKSWLSGKMDANFLGGIDDYPFLLVGFNEQGGLLLEASKTIEGEGKPFRLELLDDRNVESVDLYEAIDSFLS